jgi:hypothetical protein
MPLTDSATIRGGISSIAYCGSVASGHLSHWSASDTTTDVCCGGPLDGSVSSKMYRL